MDVTVTIEGLQALEARLTEMDAIGSQKLLRRVLRKIAKPLLMKAQQNAQSVSRSRALMASLKIVTRTFRERGAVVAAVAVTTKGKDRTALWTHNAAYRRQRKGIFYGWMLDQGHRVGTRSTGWLRKRNKNAGAGGTANSVVAPRAWWTPAVVATQSQDQSRFVQEISAAIRRIERRKSKTASPDSVVPE